jgi:hypothetical protein
VESTRTCKLKNKRLTWARDLTAHHFPPTLLLTVPSHYLLMEADVQTEDIFATKRCLYEALFVRGVVFIVTRAPPPIVPRVIKQPRLPSFSSTKRHRLPCLLHQPLLPQLPSSPSTLSPQSAPPLSLISPNSAPSKTPFFCRNPLLTERRP